MFEDFRCLSLCDSVSSSESDRYNFSRVSLFHDKIQRSVFLCVSHFFLIAWAVSLRFLVLLVHIMSLYRSVDFSGASWFFSWHWQAHWFFPTFFSCIQRCIHLLISYVSVIFMNYFVYISQNLFEYNHSDKWLVSFLLRGQVLITVSPSHN